MRLVWFRNDLRCHGHTPLTQALAGGAPPSHARVEVVLCDWGGPEESLAEALAERMALRRVAESPPGPFMPEGRMMS